MKEVTYTTDLNNLVEMSKEKFKQVVLNAIEFAINEKEYALKDLTVDFIAEDITGIIKSYHEKDFEMNKAGLAIIKQVLSDRSIEEKWMELGNEPFTENENGELILENDWLHFEKGTERDEIWYWFNEEHSRGVHYLLYEFEEGN